MLIAYCETCGFRIPETDLESGAARKKGDNQYVCAKCAGSAAATPKKPPSKGHVVPTVEAPKAAAAPLAVSIPAARRETVAPKPVAQKDDSSILVIGGGVAAVVILGLIFALSGGKSNDDSTRVSREDKKPAPVTPAVTQTDSGTKTTPRPLTTTPQPSPSNEQPVAIPKKTADQERAEQEIAQMRDERAARLLDEHKAWFAAHADDPRTYKEKLTSLIDGNRSTPAAAEAQKIVAELKIPEAAPTPAPVATNPAPSTVTPPTPTTPAVAGRGWKTLVDTSTLDSLLAKGSGGWKVENGAFVNISTVFQATQSQVDVDDGDLRIRFEIRDSQYAQFSVRLADQPGYMVELNRVEIAQMGGKTHELIFSMRGDNVSATLNGQPASVTAPAGKPKRGHLQFFARAGVMRVLSIEIAEPGAAAAAVAVTPKPTPAPTAPAINLLNDPGFEAGAFANGNNRWNNWGRCEIARSAVHAHSGECCAVLSQGTSSMGQIVTGLTPGTTYEISAWGKVSNAGESYVVGVKEYGGPDKGEKIDTTAYKRVSFKFTLGAANNSVLLYCYREGGTNVAYVDDLSLVADAAPAQKPVVAAANLILDPGFETGAWGPWPAGWYNFTSSAVTRSPENAHGGNFCVTISPGNGGFGQKVTGLTPGATYEASAWGKVANAGESFGIGVKEYGGPEVGEKIDTTTYKRVSVKFTMPAGSTSALVLFYRMGGTGAMYVDDVNLLPEGALAQVAAPTLNVATNMVTDPSFEGGAWGQPPVGWYQMGNTVVFTRTPENAHSGNVCLTLNPGNGGAGQIVSGLKVSSTYELSAWCKGANAADSLTLGLRDNGSDAKSVLMQGTTYKRYSLKFSTGPNNTTAALFVWRDGGAAQAFVDDICVVPDGALAPNSEAALLAEAGAKAGAAGADARQKYDQFLSEVSALEFKNAMRAAQTKLESAKSDPKFSGLQALIEQDVNVAKRLEALNPMAAKGAALLVDKRSFVLRKTDGKEVRVGKGNASNVVEIKDDCIVIDLDIGGAKALNKWPVDQISLPTRYELAKLASGGSGDDELILACTAMVLLQNNASGMTAQNVKAAIESAKKAGAAPELVAHLQQRMDAADAEIAADTALKKLESMISGKRLADAKAALAAIKKDYVSTQAISKLPALEAKLNDAELAVNPWKPGLWTSYWSGDPKDKFKTKHVARPETVITKDWVKGSPDPTVPDDNFALVFGGILRVEKDGKYKFTVQGDDVATLKIDNKAIKDGQLIPLGRGDHEIQIVHQEGVGDAKLIIKWKPEAGPESDLPPTSLFHDPRQIERYEKYR